MLNLATLLSELAAHGISPERTAALAPGLLETLAAGKPESAWLRLSREFLPPADPFDLHLRLYQLCYGEHALTLAPQPAWFPTPEIIARSNIHEVQQQLHLPDYTTLHRWSIENRAAYWELVLRRLNIRFQKAPERILDDSDPLHPRWLVGAKLNIVESCLNAPDDALAIIQSNGRSARRTVSYRELRSLTARIANSLLAGRISPGDAVAIVAPMTIETVAAYLAVVSVGAAVVSIADSFSAPEIAARFRIAKTKLALTQDFVDWGSKRLPLYEKVAAAAENIPLIVLTTNAATAPQLRPADRPWHAFLSNDESFHPQPRDPADTLNILFSSGTTGEPKAIPWDQTTPLKCAADAHFHHDLHSGDIACWPTSLGWMMGPWLIFAALLNRATLALYPQAPHDRLFGNFIADEKVTLLGGVPSLFRAWRTSDCMRGLDWSHLRAFSSSGECSNPSDMLYLMHLANYRPIIEYCGGTEIGGAYITSTLVQPNVPGMFTTPALGIAIEILDERGQPAPSGEAFLVGPSIGLSTRLLNRNHDEVYFADTPRDANGTPLRRHGDELERTTAGYYRVAGRCDDTMNLGGIKVGCAEIERILNTLPPVLETAAIAIPPSGGGPSRLIVFAVPRDPAFTDVESLATAMRREIRQNLNPLFHLDRLHLLPSLPRTASNKVMRRELRALALKT